MPRPLIVCSVLAALAAVLPAAADSPADAEFLKADAWEGLPGFWKVEGDTIVGESKEPLKFNTFLVSKKKYRDFDLSFKVRLKGGVGNSGVQVRSFVHDADKLALTGPQCDVGAGYWGSLYGEHFGGMMKASPADFVQESVKKDDFNDYAIHVQGRNVRITVNGTVTAEGDYWAPDEGVIGWQLHAGPPMEVTFKDIVFTPLKKK